jgi:zinc transport system permease protein
MQMIMEMLAYPFMQRAFIAGIVLGILLASLGIFVTVRKMSFFGDGIAHSSLAGIAVAVLTGLSPLPVALVWALLVALLIWRLERSTRLSSDMLIGVFFTASMALGILLMSLTRGYQPELVSFLFGSILTIQTFDLMIIVAVASLIMAWLIASFKSLTFMSLAEDSANVSGINVPAHTAALYVALAFATVLGVKILGIILVSALIILPAAASRMLSDSFRGYVVMTMIVSELMILSGLMLSYLYDLPSGATIVLVGAGFFFTATVFRLLRR